MQKDKKKMQAINIKSSKIISILDNIIVHIKKKKKGICVETTTVIKVSV